MKYKYTLSVSSLCSAVLLLTGCSNGYYTQQPVSTSTPPVVVTTTPEPPQETPPVVVTPPSEDTDIKAFTLPFHNSSKVLKVTPLPKGQDAELPSLSLSVVNPDGSSVFVGISGEVSLSGNSGAVFVPFAISKDDKNIILVAHMESPGAGGSSQDYGYIMLPIQPAPNKNYILVERLPANKVWTSIHIATRSAHFYDSFGKVVYVDEGDNTPHYDMPGPSNNATLMFRNFVTGDNKKILAEKDTSYEIVSLDEKSQSLEIKATHYTFSAKCLREQSGLYCADKTVTDQTIKLP